MKLKFTKMHGIGNDYVYIDCTGSGALETLPDPARLSKLVSDRHFGIGSDGLILIAPSKKADLQMIMYNADGSRGEMCGNGIRCVGKYAYDHGLTTKKELTVETLAGVRELTLFTGDDDKVEKVRVDMGEAVLDTRKIPVTYPEDTMIGQPLEVKGKIYNATCISTGNPHCVIFCDNDIKKMDIEKLGPSFERHPLFPKRINTEFVNILDRSHIAMRVYERGSGETLACGTGACASAVASFLNGFTDEKVEVRLLGGTLFIEYDEKTKKIYMTGPATEVFTGEMDIFDFPEDEDVKVYE
ncbi:MAG: diaminopimelate epimerase [Lachnospiraceae bacterium]|nr:diaminopimelate epimerase [Lachnospiraceae bacterium]